MINSFTRSVINSIMALTLIIPTSARLVPGAQTNDYSSTIARSKVDSIQKLDAFGNVVQGEPGNRFNNMIQEGGYVRAQVDLDAKIIEKQTLSIDPVDQSQNVGQEVEEVVQVSLREYDADYMVEKWRTGIWGTGIGVSGISSFDLDNDGNTEIVTGGGYLDGGDRFWYILSFYAEGGYYQQEWLSDEYTADINRIVVSDYNYDQHYEIYVGLEDGSIEIYDATTRELIGSFTSTVGTTGMTVADVDNDDEQEIVATSESGLAVYNALTYASEWQTFSYGSSDIAVANVDGDISPEIVTLSYVIDGISHSVDWYYPDMFGAIIHLADIDADQMAELVAAKDWYHIYAYDADLQTVKWELPSVYDIQALYVDDIDNDQVQEVVFGNGQWGYIHVYDSITLTEEWNIANPQYGVTDISFGDVDNDDVTEVLWGSGWGSTGPDYLFIGNTLAHVIEWQSVDFGGPLSALDVGDLDNDGTNEIVMVSFNSDSGYEIGRIFIYNAKTYVLEWLSEPLPYIISGELNALVLGDVDEDGVLEIVIGADHYLGGVIIAIDGISHNLDWITTEFGTSFSTVDISDTDNDGHLEVIGGQQYNEPGSIFVCVFDGLTGALEWQVDDLTAWGGVYDIDSGDLNEDGIPEILWSLDNGQAYIFDGITHLQEWQSSFSNTRAVAIIDIDQDGYTEFLVGDSTGTVYAYEGQSFSLEWSQSLSTSSINSLQSADFDKDGAKELVLSSNNYLYVYDAATRDLLWQSPYLGSSVGKFGQLVVRNIDQDTRDEVVVGSNYAMFVFTYDLLPFGASISVDKKFAPPGGTLGYMLGLEGLSESPLTVVMTNVIPANTEYITGSLWASSGTWSLINNTIVWTVDLTPTLSVSMTYAATIPFSVTHGTEIVNSAVFSGGAFIETRSTATFVDALPPVIGITQPISGELISGDIYPILGMAIDEDSGLERVEINLNASGWQSATGLTNWSYEWTLPITDELFIIEARAFDRVGNVETIPMSVIVFVDNLSPYIVATNPSHGTRNVGFTQPIIIEFSEPIRLETFQYVCAPDPGNWTITANPDHTVFTLNHDPFDPLQMYSCMVASAEDRAFHSLTSGPTPNPWGFITTAYTIYLPVVPRDSSMAVNGNER